MLKTIKNKLIFGVILLVLFIQLSSSLIQFFQVRSIVYETLELEAQNLSTLIYQTLIKNLVYTESEEQEAILEQMEAFGNIRLGVHIFPQLIQAQKKLQHIQFIDINRNILGHDIREKKGQKIDPVYNQFLSMKDVTFVEEKDQISVFVPFVYLDNFYGGLIYSYSKESIIKESNRILRTFIVSFLIYTILGAFGVWVLSNTILKPINELANVVERLSDGNLQERIDTSRKDEIGRLSKTFAFMRDSIREKIKVIEDYSKTLEQKVEERTEQLKRKTEESEESKEALKVYSQELAEKNELIEEQYRTLEKKVEERTRELQISNQELHDSLQSLHKAQQQLILQEKMASLGGLVAGVAHEINTPVGIGVTLASHLYNKTQEINEHFEGGELYEDSLKEYFKLAMESHHLILENLNQSSELIDSFKKIAVDQSSESKRAFNLKTYLERVILNLNTKLKRTPHKLELKCPPDIELDSYPGSFSQIVTNFVLNSLTHAFDNESEGLMSLDVKSNGYLLTMAFSDNGKGIPTEIQSNVFDPFFTTIRGEGGSGLGLHIIYNIVTQQMNGDIKLQSENGKGSCFTLSMPIIN